MSSAPTAVLYPHITESLKRVAEQALEVWSGTVHHSALPLTTPVHAVVKGSAWWCIVPDHSSSGSKHEKHRL
jgi:hypothetical protein